MFVVVVVADFHVFQYAERVVGEHGAGEVERQQIAGHAETIETHQPRRQARHDLARNAGLMQTDDS